MSYKTRKRIWPLAAVIGVVAMLAVLGAIAVADEHCAGSAPHHHRPSRRWLRLWRPLPIALHRSR